MLPEAAVTLWEAHNGARSCSILTRGFAICVMEFGGRGGEGKDFDVSFALTLTHFNGIRLCNS